MNDQLTPNNMRFPNDTNPPDGFCNEPRVLSLEVWQLNHQVAALCDAIARLCDLQRETASKLDALTNNSIVRG